MKVLRRCIHCGKEATTKEDLELFIKDKSVSIGIGNKCKQCANRLHREWNATKRGKEVQKDSKLKRTYGIDLNEYNALYVEQRGRCRICGITDKKLVVDHNHSTGKVRGLLCSNCNTGIGLLNDNPNTLAKAISYLTEEGYYGEH